MPLILLKSKVYTFLHNSHSSLTSYSLSSNSYSSFRIHFKYYLISEVYEKVILLCSRSINLVLLKLSHHTTCFLQVSMDFSRVGAINYFPYISWQFLTQNNPTVNVNNQRKIRWSIFSYLKTLKTLFHSENIMRN